jgi:hydrogenase maturation protease
MTTPAERGNNNGNRTSLLVIGYGNSLRSDDGVGPKTAEALAELNLPGVRTLSCHQLTPEMAVPIAAAQCVVFVDAAVDSKTSVDLQELEPAGPGQTMAHAPDPRQLLKLAREIFGRTPSAFLITIPAENLDFGEQLSARAQQGSREALQKIRAFLE